MFFNAFSLFTPATGPVYNRAHTPINLGCVTGNYYQTGIVQECLCIKLPKALTDMIADASFHSKSQST
jgi:hypothetical protein